MVVSHQRLDDRQSMPASAARYRRSAATLGISGCHPGPFAVVAEHRPQSRRGQRPSAVRALGDEEQRAGACLHSRRAARAADSAGSAQRPRRRPEHGVPSRPSRSPAPTPARCRRRRPPARGPRPLRSPENSISPAIAWSRTVRKLASSSAISSASPIRAGSRRGSQTRSPRPQAPAPRGARAGRSVGRVRVASRFAPAPGSGCARPGRASRETRTDPTAPRAAG